MASAAASRPTNALVRLLDSTVGLKILMAATGAIWVGFVVQHMVANLQVFLPMPADGVHPLTRYAANLKALGPLIWVARAFLLATFATHVVTAIRLGARSQAARPVAYRDQRPQVSPATARTMRASGMAILGFVLYHLAHFTGGVVDTAAFARVAGDGSHDVYAMVIAGLRNPVAAGVYVFASVLVAAHLHHAVSSIFQTLGLRSRAYRGLIDRIGVAVAVTVGLGNVAMPIAVLLGLIGQGVV
jgi:succinate dehydrogenase / fumarate reductase cytochrome b subunit